MRYMAIGKTPFKLTYAVFDGRTLMAYGKHALGATNENRRLVEWKRLIDGLIETCNPSFVLTHLLDKERMMKKDIEKIVEIRTVTKIAVEEKRKLYAEFKTDGWEWRIVGKRPTAKRKLELVNRDYDIGLRDVDVADAIILCEGVAWQKLQIGV